MKEKNLNAKIMSGMIWKFAERFAAQGVSFLVSMILARLLMPEDYGIVAIINIFISIADIFLSSGLNTALIQKQDVDDLEFTTVFWCNLFLGGILYFVLFFCAPLLAEIYDIPLLVSTIRVLALRLPFSAFQSIQIAYVSRKMDFKQFFYSTFVGTILSAIVGIVMALKGMGVWALIAQALTNTVFVTLCLFVIVRWYPKFQFSIKAARPLVRYGSKVMITDLIGTVCNQLGDLIIGIKYTATDLAYYTKGKQLPNLFKTNIYVTLISVLFPGMSKVNDEKESVKVISRKSIEALTYIIFPVMTGLIIVAEPLTILMYTEKWVPIVPFIQIVCFEAMASVPGTITLQAIKAMGRSDMMLKAECIKKPILLLSLFCSLKFGVVAVAWTLPLNALIEFIINSIMVKKVIKYSIHEQLMDCASALFMSLLMGFALFLTNFLNIDMLLLLIVELIVGIVIYLSLSYVLKNKTFYALLNMLKMRAKH